MSRDATKGFVSGVSDVSCQLRVLVLKFVRLPPET